MEKPVWSVTRLYFNHMKNFITILLFIVSLPIAGCFDAFSTIEYDNRLMLLLPKRSVYAAGFAYDTACYWKDGEEIILGDPIHASAAYTILFYGEDVYAGGYQGNATCAVACYWKNGNRTDIGGGVHSSSVNSLVISGTDVYAGGYESNGSVHVACYWKNGIKTVLGDGTYESEVNSIVLSGSDVYAGGYQYIDTVNDIACYWKNDSATRTNLAGSTSRVLSLVISGTYIYAGGYAGANAYYWKNGVPSNLGSGRVHALYLSGADVYAGGYYVGGSPLHDVACYWKNNSSTRTDLGLEKASMVLSLVVSGSFVYTSGLWSNDLGTYNACYWVNGARTDLNNTFSYANSIYIK
jgi:hypothetical protein